MKYIFIVILISFKMTYSQNKNPNQEVQKLIDLGKAKIIELAFSQIKKQDADISKDDFHFISVKASNRRIIVNFGYNLIYLPINSSYYSDIKVELPSNRVSKDIISNESNNSNYYRPTIEHINGINKALNQEDKKTDVYHKGKSWSVTIIYEKEDRFLINSSAREPHRGGGYSKEEVDKKTGEVLSSLMGQYATMPEILPRRGLNGELIEREEFININE